MPLFRIGLLAFFLIGLEAQALWAAGRQFFVAPGGNSAGDGSMSSPWDLATALAGPAEVQPGDTIWLRGGTYRGGFKSRLSGRQDAPIVVRQYPGERAVIDASGFPNVALDIAGSWTWYWGFEVTNSDTTRFHSTRGSNPPGLTRAHGVEDNGPYTRLINLIVHDTNQGIGCWTPAEGAEVYGCLIYNNGWDAPDRGHGHGIYTQNREGAKRIEDNIIFNQFSYGIHAYTEQGYIDNFHIEGNISFGNGILSKVSGIAGNILVGGGKVPQNPVVLSNCTYYPLVLKSGSNNFGYGRGSNRLVLKGNYFVGGTAAIVNKAVDADISKNFFYGQTRGITNAEYPDNIYAASRPRRNEILVRRNRYEENRYQIAIYNWERKGSVRVKLPRAAMRRGDRYEIRNAQSYFGKVVNGTFSGDSIRVSLSDRTVSRPAGWDAPPSTLPEFGVFILTVHPRTSASPRASALR